MGVADMAISLAATSIATANPPSGAAAAAFPRTSPLTSLSFCAFGPEGSPEEGLPLSAAVSLWSVAPADEGRAGVGAFGATSSPAAAEARRFLLLVVGAGEAARRRRKRAPAGELEEAEASLSLVALYLVTFRHPGGGGGESTSRYHRPS